MIFNNTGTEAGTYSVASGATLNLNGTRSFGAGTSVSGAGTLQVASGTVDFNAGSSLGVASTGSFLLSGGTANFNLGATNFANGLNMTGGALGGSSNLSAGTATLTSGTLFGTGSLTTSGLVGVGDITLAKVWNAQGSTTLSAANIVRFNNGTINNSGTFDFNGTQTVPLLDGGTSAFNNSGTVNKTTSTVANVNTPFNNSSSGIVNVNGGSLIFNNNLSNAGTLAVSAGTTLGKPGGFTNNGIIAGGGTIDVTGSTLSNGTNGIIRPDGGGADQTGTLSITGNFVQTAAGTLDMDVEGNAAGQFDRLAITGTSSLDGTLKINAINGYVATGNQLFDFLTYANNTGIFSTINAAAFGNPAPSYGATSLTITTPTGCLVDDCWIGTSGDWSVGSNWSTGLAPTAGQKVLLNVAGLQTITMTAGTFNLADITSSENLSFTGGTLATTGNFLMGVGTVLNLGGAAITANGTLTAQVVNLSAGSLAGAGTMTISSDFNQTGGSFAPTGSVDLTRSLGNFNIGSLALNGIAKLTAVGGFNVNLTGNVSTSNTGLAAGTAAISINAAGNLNIASTANLLANGSGGVSLTSGGSMDLKVNDGGNNGSANSISAAGNVSLIAGGGIGRSDGNTVGIAGANVALTAAGSVGALGGAITANSGNANVTSTGGAITISSLAAAGGSASVSAANALDIGSATAGMGINFSSSGTMTLGTLSNSAGAIMLVSSGATSDINLSGNVVNSAGGFTGAQTAFNATAGRNLNISSTTDISTSSGAVNLVAANSIDLKVNDGGNNGSSNSISAAGDLAITATAGSVVRSDGNTVSLTAANLSLSAASGIQALGGSIIASAGNVALNAANSVAFTDIQAAGPGGNVTITSSAANVLGGTLTAGQNITLNLNTSGSVNLGLVTAGTSGNGLVSLTNTGKGAVNLNGSVQTSNAGLAAGSAAIFLNTAGNLNLASTTNLQANGSGGINLTSGGNLDLKVNDGGNNGSGNSITASGNVQINSAGTIQRSDGNTVAVSGTAISITSVGAIGPLGGAITASTGNANVTSTAGQVTITSIAASNGLVGVLALNGLDIGNTTAGTGVNLASGGTMTLGPVTNSAGAIVLTTSGASSDIVLNGDITNTAGGFAGNQAAISATAGRDLRIASTAGLSTGSGALVLLAAQNVDLKVNDGGNNSSANALTAAGNLDITATAGAILRSDGNAVSVTASNLNLTAGSSIGAFGGGITATVGNVALNAPGTVDFTAINASGPNGNVSITSSATNVTGGTLSAGRNIALNLNSSGGVNLGTVTAGTGGNGTVNISNTGTGVVNLNGTVQANNAGLPAAAVAVNINVAGNLNIASTTDLVANGSGGVSLTTGGAMDLKVNDGGNNGSANGIMAQGNVVLSAGAGIGRSDGNGVGLTGAAIVLNAAGAIGSLGAAITAGSGNANLTSTGGAVSVNSIVALGGSVGVTAAGSLDIGTATAGTGINLASGGTMTLGPLNNTGGAIVLAANGASSDINFNGSVNNTATGFAAGQMAFSATAGRDLQVSSTADVNTSSGGISLLAARNIDLKVNDGGNNGSANSIHAAGNLTLAATTGQILRSDGNAVIASAQTIALTFATALDNNITLQPAQGIFVTQTVGDLHPVALNTPTQMFTAVNGNVVFDPGSAFSAPVTVGAGSGNTLFTGGVVSFSNGFTSNRPVQISGGNVSIGGPAPQTIDSAWTVTGGVLNLSSAGTVIVSTGGLDIGVGGTANVTGNLTNGGTISANGNLTLAGDFFNQANATANLANLNIGGGAYNFGNFNVGGTVTILGATGQQGAGVLSIPAGANLNMSNPAGVFGWSDGTIGGTGNLAFTNGATFNFAGNGGRVIDGLNFAFNNLTLPNGSLTLKSGSLTLAGSTVLPTGVALNLDGGTLNNLGSLAVAGNFSLTGGAFTGPGSLSMAGGSLSLPTGNSVAWTNSGPLTNTGTLNLAGSNITNAIDNQGTIVMGSGLSFAQPVTSSGTLVAQAGSATQFNGGLTQRGSGAVELQGGSISGGINVNGGFIRGVGTINGDLVVGSATLAPGFSPGAITINGNLVMVSNSALNIELGGLLQGTGYDWINVSGTSTLAGTLNVNSYAGFVPPVGSSYNFMSFASKTGNFATVNLNALPGLAFSNTANALTLTQGGGAIVLPVLAPAPAPVNLPVVSPVIATEERLTTVSKLVAEIKVQPDPKKDREPELEACP